MAEEQGDRPVAATAAVGGELLSLGEAARLLGISQRTVQRLLERGELKGTKVGRQWRFHRADLTAYVNREPEAVAAPPEADLSLALDRLEGWSADIPPTIAAFSGDVETEELTRLVPEPVIGLCLRI